MSFRSYRHLEAADTAEDRQTYLLPVLVEPAVQWRTQKKIKQANNYYLVIEISASRGRSQSV